MGLVRSNSSVLSDMREGEGGEGGEGGKGGKGGKGGEHGTDDDVGIALRYERCDHSCQDARRHWHWRLIARRMDASSIAGCRPRSC